MEKKEMNFASDCDFDQSHFNCLLTILKSLLLASSSSDCFLLIYRCKKNTEAITDKNKIQRERNGEEKENRESHKSEPKPIKFYVLRMAYTAIQYDNNSC